MKARYKEGRLYIEFGGPKVAHKFELATVKSPDEIENEKVEIIGPDIGDLNLTMKRKAVVAILLPFW